MAGNGVAWCGAALKRRQTDAGNHDHPSSPTGLAPVVMEMMGLVDGLI